LDGPAILQLQTAIDRPPAAVSVSALFSVSKVAGLDSSPAQCRAGVAKPTSALPLTTLVSLESAGKDRRANAIG
jgi:hypothetical protein